MISLLLHLLRLFPFLSAAPRARPGEPRVAPAARRVQENGDRPKLRTTDRLFWVWLAKARVLGAGVLWPPVVSLTLGWSGRAQPVVQRPQTHRARHRALLPKETPPQSLVLFLYSVLHDAGFIGDDETVGGAPQSTNTVRRLAFGAAGFTALMIGVQAGGKRNRSRRASSDRETSSENSCSDASNGTMGPSPPT